MNQSLDQGSGDDKNVFMFFSWKSASCRNNNHHVKVLLLPDVSVRLCSQAPNRPWTGIGPLPGVWGPLLYVKRGIKIKRNSRSFIPCTNCLIRNMVSLFGKI